MLGRAAGGVVRVSAPPRAVEAPQTLQAALGYLQHGWSVIPAPVGAKRSLVQWKRWQTIRPDAELWQAWAERWPRCNLAVITGRLSGIVILDVDPRHGGTATLTRLEREHGELPTTAVVLTPSGGRHVYFTHPGGRVANVQNSTTAPGLDLRGDGGLALLPPSRRADGQRYEWWQGPDELAPLPGWVDASLRPRRATEHASSSVATTRLDDARTAIRFEAILRILRNAPEGGRNTSLFWCALRVRDLIAEGAPSALAAQLEDAAVARGLPRAEAKRTITSGLDAEVRP
jgi:Bifunctional DNA primase/polymerase, N-terminal